MIPRDIAREIDRLERQLRLLGGGTVRQAVAGGGGGSGGTTLTNNCECDTGLVYQGITLPDSPTICCTGHDRLRINFGDWLGERVFYHTGGNFWSTFNADSALDNPVVVECYPDEDEYDLVLELTAINAAKITLEARAALNCDAICIEYDLVGVFSCQGANRFVLSNFSGISSDNLPRCVCAIPDGAPAEEFDCLSDSVEVAYSTYSIYPDGEFLGVEPFSGNPPDNEWGCGTINQELPATLGFDSGTCRWSKSLHALEPDGSNAAIACSFGGNNTGFNAILNPGPPANLQFRGNLDGTSCLSYSPDATMFQWPYGGWMNLANDFACSGEPSRFLVVGTGALLSFVRPTESGRCTECGS